MLRRLLTSALVLGGAVVLFAPSANAQSVNVPFTASVGAVCAFDPPTPGTLVFVPNSGSGNPALVANSTTGTRGSVGFNCSAPANFTASAPIQTSGSAISPTLCVTTISGGATNSLSSCVGISAPAAISGSGILNVAMRVESTSVIPPGDYAYNVTLTIVP
jgi:hypothetical protein